MNLYGPVKNVVAGGIFGANFKAFFHALSVLYLGPSKACLNTLLGVWYMSYTRCNSKSVNTIV